MQESLGHLTDLPFAEKPVFCLLAYTSDYTTAGQLTVVLNKLEYHFTWRGYLIQDLVHSSGKYLNSHRKVNTDPELPPAVPAATQRFARLLWDSFQI